MRRKYSRAVRKYRKALRRVRRYSKYGRRLRTGYKRRRRGLYRPTAKNIKNGQIVTFSRLGTLWPDKFLFKHSYRYNSVVSFITLGVPADNRRYANNPYDPDPAIGGDSAYWLNTLSRVYSYFYTPASKIIINFTADSITELPSVADTPTSVNCFPAYFFIIPHPDGSTSPSTDFDDLQQAAYVKYKRINRTLAAGRYYTVKHYMTLKKLMGYNPKWNSNFFGTGASGPNNLAFWWFGARSQAAGDNLQGYVNVKVVYYTEWFRRIPQTTPGT